MEEIYRRYVSASAKKLPNRQLRCDAGLLDTFHEAHLEVDVDRETRLVVGINGEMTRSPHYETCSQSTHRLQELVGLNAWMGAGRTIREVFGGAGGCGRWEELVFAAVQVLIQADGAVIGQETPWEEMKQILMSRFRGVCNAYSHMDTNEIFQAGRPPRPVTNEVWRRYLQANVRIVDDRTLRVGASLSDSGHEVYVDMDVDLPSRRISKIQGAHVRPPFGGDCANTCAKLQDLVGQLAWPSETRNIKQIVGGSSGCSRFEEAIIEGVRAVMQAHVVLAQRQMTRDPEGARQLMATVLGDTCYGRVLS